MTSEEPLPRSNMAEGKHVLGSQSTVDNLLETYLGLLEQYVTLRDSLSNMLSWGFLSLAQANFTAPHRLRYGQDLYDARMQATLTVSLGEPLLETSVPTFEVISSLSPPFKESSDPFLGRRDPLKQPECPRSAQVPLETASQLELSPLPSIILSTTSQRDPIRQFGILVPPALRAAQKAFSEGSKVHIPQLVHVIARMRALEMDIETARE